MSIKNPSAVDSPYVTTSTSPTVLNSAPGVQKAVQTASQVAADQAIIDTTVAVANRSYYANGQSAIDSLVTTSRTGVFAGANVTLAVTEQNYITQNKIFTGSNIGNSISVSGNITSGEYFIGDGSQLTGISSLGNFIVNGNSKVDVVSPGGNVVVNTNGNTWTFTPQNKLIAPGGSQWTNAANADAYFTSSLDGYVHLQSLYSDGNIGSEMFLQHGLATITAHAVGANADYTWTFDNSANLGLPFGSNISDTAGTLIIEANTGSALNLRTTSGNAYSEIYSNATVQAQISITDQLTGANPAWAVIEADMANVNTPTAVVILKPGNTGTEVRWTYNANGTTEFPNNVINPGNNQPLTLRTQSSGNAYTVMYQSSNSWEAYAEDDTTEANSAYAWIKADLNTANTPRVFINNVRGGDGLDSTWTFDDAGNLTLPNGALLKDTSGDSVAFGLNAGANSQQQHSVAIGPGAGNINQGEDSVAIGWDAGANNQVRMGIAIGWNAGNDNQGQNSQAYGQSAGAYYQQSGAVAMGLGAGRYLQGQEAVAIGQYAGYGGLSSATVASMPSPDVVRIFGSTSTLYNGMTVVGGSITPGNGLTIVGLSGEDITLSSVPAEPLTNGDNLNFYPAQATGAVAIGGGAGQTLQAQNAVAVGYLAGQTRQGYAAVSIGEDSGGNLQGVYSVAVGTAAGYNTQGNAAVAMGWNAGYQYQGTTAVAIGEDAGYTTQGNAAVALGLQAGYDTQGANAIAIGYTAGLSAQGNVAIAIGMNAGRTTQGTAAVAMGWNAGNTNQGNAAVAIGEDAGFTNQGEYSIAIGYQAGYNSQGNNSIVLNASGDQINGITANSFTVKPIRSATTGNVLYYDQQSGEITFDVGGSGGLPLANGTSNINIATANSNVTITANSTQTWTFGTTGNTTFPNGAIFTGYDFYAAANSYIELAGDTGNTYMGVSNTVAFIQTDWGGAQNQWTFGADGNLTTPGASGDISGANVISANIFSATGNVISGNVNTGTVTLTNGAVIKDTAGDAVAFGQSAGLTSQGNNAVAIGNSAGGVSQGVNSVAVGRESGNTSQGVNSVAIGFGSGFSNQGNEAVAVGSLAGVTSQANNSIILNATGSALNQTVANTFTVKPVRGDSTANLTGNGFKAVYYNSSTGEFAYSTD